MKFLRIVFIKKPRIREISLKNNEKNKIDKKLDKVFDNQQKRRMKNAKRKK